MEHRYIFRNISVDLSSVDLSILIRDTILIPSTRFAHMSSYDRSLSPKI